jgi:hypothetical protein
METSQTCPRRMAEFGPWKSEEGIDSWRNDNTCSFCGSLKPEIVLEAIEAGKEVTPTDKSYKLYVDGHRKAYFQHFSDEQRTKLIELVNAKKISFAFPGYFYVLPFFARTAN